MLGVARAHRLHYNFFEMKAILTQTKTFKKKRSWSSINLDAMVDIIKVWISISVTNGTPEYFNIIKGEVGQSWDNKDHKTHFVSLHE